MQSARLIRRLDLARAAKAAGALGLALALSGCFTTKGDIEVAVKATEIEPKTPMRSGWSYLEEGAYQAAATAFKLKLAKDETDEDARYGLAQALRYAGRPAAAEAHYAKLLNSVERRTDALTGIGYSKLSTFESDGAEAAFLEATEADPTAWKAWLGLAQLDDLELRWLQADKKYEQALKYTDNRALVLNNFGVSMLARGDSERAVSLLEQALALDPSQARTRTNYEAARSTLGKMAAHTADAPLDARDRARKLNNVAYVAMLRGDIPQAEQLFDEALETHPSFYPVAEKNKQVLKAIKSTAD